MQQYQKRLFRSQGGTLTLTRLSGDKSVPWQFIIITCQDALICLQSVSIYMTKEQLWYYSVKYKMYSVDLNRYKILLILWYCSVHKAWNLIWIGIGANSLHIFLSRAYFSSLWMCVFFCSNEVFRAANKSNVRSAIPCSFTDNRNLFHPDSLWVYRSSSCNSFRREKMQSPIYVITFIWNGGFMSWRHDDSQPARQHQSLRTKELASQLPWPLYLWRFLAWTMCQGNIFEFWESANVFSKLCNRRVGRCHLIHFLLNGVALPQNLLDLVNQYIYFSALTICDDDWKVVGMQILKQKSSLQLHSKFMLNLEIEMHKHTWLSVPTSLSAFAILLWYKCPFLFFPLSNGNAVNLPVSEGNIIQAPEGEGCPKCGGFVYHADQVFSKDKAYHKQCFKCTVCHRQLDSRIACDGPDRDIYCNGGWINDLNTGYSP